MSERIQKLLAQQGIASRRQIEQWIKEGRIRVNGQLASLGLKVELTDKFSLDEEPIDIQAPDEETHVLLYHKPVGEVCTRYDPEDRVTVFSALPELKQGRWIAVGRLDYNTSGLLLFSNNGDIANKLAHPRYGFEREYRVRIYGEVKPEVLTRLLKGVMLEDGIAAFKTIEPGIRRGRNQWFKVSLGEGRNRIVRRLWASQDFVVNRLERIRFGPIHLADLPVGQHRFLTKTELEALFDANNTF